MGFVNFGGLWREPFWGESDQLVGWHPMGGGTHETRSEKRILLLGSIGID